MTGKYKSLSFKEKLLIIAEVKKGIKSKSSIAQEWGIPASTLSTYLKNEKKILEDSDSKKNKLSKRLKKQKYPEVNKCLLKWFKQQRDKNIPISGIIMKAKAEEFAISLNITNFKASSGWLDCFKKQNDIIFKKICGESGAVNLEAATDWKELLKDMISDRDPKNIFNVDEAGLFYQCTPDKSLAFKNEKCTGGKYSKQRITLLIGANMDGSEKLPLFMIGKSANPRCFKNIKNKPVKYTSNNKAWMTSDIFEKWLLDLDKKMYKENRTIVLFIDNCTAHKSIPLMSNIKVIFLPPNMTSVLQPMDQGVIKNFKHFYRQFVVKHILAGKIFIKNTIYVKINIFFLICRK